MRFGSVCSGIEAASVAWNPMGWQASFVSEIDRFPCEVLEHHHGSVPNYGDMTKFKDWPDATIDVLVGGTPCQSFSVAGLRKGLDDPRGNLMLTYLAIAARYRPEWLVWENVPGVLSSGGGRDFGSLLGGLAELGYGFAYRILDAQYFGLAQRRQRVFVVGCAGGWRRAAAVLFERASLRGDSAPSRSTRKGLAAPLAAGSPAGSGYRNDADTTENLITQGGVSRSLTVGGRFDYETETFVTHPLLAKANSSHDDSKETYVTHALRADGFDASEDGTGPGTPLVAQTLGSKGGRNRIDEDYIAFAQNQRDEVRTMDVAGALAKEAGTKQQTYVHQSMAVRRLTPGECETLQGFPRGYTAITRANGKPAADGPRYKALGNSMAVPVMAWIGRRIQQCSQCAKQGDAS